MDTPAFMGWLSRAKPGERVEYHRGYLPRDKTHEGIYAGYPAMREELYSIAKAVMKAEEKGLVLPVQKRLGDGYYSYIAVRAVE